MKDFCIVIFDVWTDIVILGVIILAEKLLLLQENTTQESSSQGKRIAAIDVAKGIGILLVVFAHIVGFNLSNTIIYSFHMPLFFILSGMVMNVEKYRSFKCFIKNKLKSLIVPYLFFCLLSIAIVFILYLVVEISETPMFLLKSLYSVFWSPYSLDFNTPLWFLPCLFITELMYYLIYRLCKKKYLICIFTAIIVACGWIAESKLIPFDFSILPFNLSSACFSLGFLAIGNLFAPFVKQKLLHQKNTKSTIIKCLCICVLSFCIMTVFALINGKVNIGGGTFSNGVWTYISGVSGTLGILCLSQILCNSRFLNFCGKNSLTIMGCHMLIVSVILDILPLFSRIGLGFICEFKLLHEIIFSILLFIITLLLSLLFTILYNRVLAYIKNKKAQKLNA